MAYVDLNPIRAGIATTPEASDHTSINARVAGNDDHLLPFARCSGDANGGVPINRSDNLQLIDWSGRAIRSDKRGLIPVETVPKLQCLRLEADGWINEMHHHGKWYYRAVGSLQTLDRYREYLGQKWLKGLQKCPSRAT